MKLGTKTRYATRAMLSLAEHHDQGMLSSREIAAEQEVSVKYLEQLLSTLRSAGLIRSVRGAAGGHALARPPMMITLRQVYESIEGSQGLAPCQGDSAACQRAGECASQEVWGQVYEAAMSVLEATTLADLVTRSAELQGVGSCVSGAASQAVSNGLAERRGG